MADVDEGVATEVAAPTPSTSTFDKGIPSLRDYAQNVEALTGEKVTNDFPDASESTDEATEAEAEVSHEESTEPAKEEPKAEEPKELDIAELLKDKRFQSEIDRRAAAQAKANQDRFAQQQAEQAAATAREQAEAHYVELVNKANGDPYDEGTQAASKELAELESYRLTQESMYKQIAPEVRWSVVQDLSDQLNSGFAKIPEFQYQEVVDKLHNSRFDNAGEWVENLVNGISSIRVAAATKELNEKHATEVDRKAKELAETYTAEHMAQYRATLPSPDISTGVVDGAAAKRYTNKQELARDVDSLLGSGRMSTAEYRRLRDSLPEN